MIQYPTDPTFIAAMPDAEVLRAYQQTSGEPGDDEADALLTEISRRELDV